MKSPHVRNITDNEVNLLFSRIIYLTRPIFLYLLLTDDHPEHLLPLAQVTPLLEVGSHPKTCVLPVLCSPKATFNVLDVQHFFPILKHAVLRSLPFFGYAKVTDVTTHT